jgi:7,8-dihydropterin-6-yl-methyl-4-(beta-D-ribofuranosyl)aminobenzene 5'-phosphate synthase
MLTQVESLEFTVLVDNSIEWMTKLPPGFSSELRQHLEGTPPIDPVTQVPIIDLDHYCCGAHGLSILIVSFLSQAFNDISDSVLLSR